MKKTGWVLCFLLSLQLLSGLSQGCFLVGDLNGDCRVDIQDLVIMASQWMGPSCENEAGLILHWRLDETGGMTAADSSGGGRHGTVVGAQWNPMGGILRGALQFDGINDYVWSSYQGITGSNARTCAAWIKTDRAPGDMISWGNRDVDGGRWVVRLDPTGVLRVDAGGGYVIGTTVLTDDLWHHITVTFDGSTTDSVILYIDGKLETIGGIVPHAVNTQAWATTKLGVFQLALPAPSHYFDGLIDDARIYNRALHLKEVWNLATTASTLYDCADLNTDQTVTLSDVAVLSENWGAETPQVLINEFLASNQSRSPLGPGQIFDGNFDASDWIELYNNSQMPVDISGWYLTDDVGNPTQWRFPLGQPILQPGDYLLVFASGKTEAENPGNYPYVDPAGYLHTNFSLSKDGEYLGLFAADGITSIHEYDHLALGGGVYGYPPQEDDISYGYYYGEPRYFAVPTPGAANIAGAFTGFVEKPAVNVKGGCYETGFDLMLSGATEGAFIRYTLDGTVPSLVHGLEYTGPIAINSLTTLIAKAFKPGLHPSEARIETYIFVEPTVAAFHSNLPLVIVDTLGQTIPSDKILRPFVSCRAVIIDTDKETGRASVIGSEYAETSGIAEIRFRGESTYGTGHYALEFRDEYGLDRNVSLLGMPAESDWILSYDRIDYTLLKNDVAFKWFRDMGHYAPRQRYVEVYLNTGGGKIKLQNFFGIMVLREQIDRDKNRVAIARLDESHNLEPKVSGGYIIKHDKHNVGDTLLADGPGGIVDPDYLESAPYGIQVTGTGKPILQYPPARRVTLPQIEWIASYMNQVSAVLWQNTSSSFYPGPEFHYTDYLDTASWIDHGIVEQAGLDSDAFWGSYRMHKDRDGKIFSGPVWDFDRGFHNNAGTYNQSYNVWRTNGGLVGRWHQRMEQDNEYKIQLADRWYEHRKSAINTDQTLAHIDARVALMSEAMARTTKPFPNGYTWQQEVDFLKTWIVNRLNWLDGEIASRFAARPPIFNPAGGEVNLGDVLYISKPAGAPGIIYYTLDGSDPRLPGGAINPDAQIYTETHETTTESIVTLSSSVWKYLYDGSDQGTVWRAYGFDDSSWGSGPGRLGFGQDGIVTDIGPRVAVRRSAYFRHKFNVSNVSAITALEMTVVHDDGAVVYLNGQEIGRIFMPNGEIHYDTLATTTVHSTPATTVFNGISPDFLIEGENIFAVSVHQVNEGSSDIVFDLNVEATRVAGPAQIVFDRNLHVRSRIKDGNNWSAQNQARFTIPMALAHFWCFTDALVNNTPLAALDASYSLVGPGVIEYQSALQGYPFDPQDDNWLKASMERRNAPTDINYRPEGNRNLEYDDGFMRGLQVKQPFVGDGGENTLIFHLPTTGYERVVFNFAAMDEGAAEGLVIDYSVAAGAPQWQPFGTYALLEGVYQHYEIEFYTITEADDNPDFKVRIRFDAANAQADEGNRVTFNNIALDALSMAGYGRQLSAGDIAVIAMNAAEAEEFAWMPLVDLPAGTVIHFTDSSHGTDENGVFYDRFRWTEHLNEEGGGPLTWRHTDRVIAGTVIKLHIEEKSGSVRWNIGTHTGTQPHLSTSGDQIFVYQGEIVENTVSGVGNYVGDYSDAKMLYGINWANPGWAVSGPGSTGSSYVPYGLGAAAQTAIHIGPENNYYYTGPVVGPRTYLLDQIALPANWAGDDGLRNGGYLDLLPPYFVLGDQTGSLSLLHYWHFNDLIGEMELSVPADYTVLGSALITYPGDGDGYMDSTSGSDLNARLGRQAGQCLRVRNPSSPRELLLTLPTSGYQAVQLSYAVMRTTGGARNQTIQYRTSNVGDWHTLDTITVPESYQFFRFDFSGIPAADNNPEFAVRILFSGLNAASTSGNNRFDNITLEGLPLPGTNPPPQLIEPIPFTKAIVDTPTVINLSQYMIDPDGGALTFVAEADKPFVVQTNVIGNTLTLTPQYQGDAMVTVAAYDGFNPPLEISFRVLAYPAAHPLSSGVYQFGYWSPGHPEHTFPDGMLFLQSNVSDPGLTAALNYPYFIPHDDYHADDQAIIGYPYMTTGRTRLNGLYANGISFINTGRGRDLGGALVALDTTGLQAVNVNWLAGTLLANSRRYALRLQYRVGIEGDFEDVLVGGQPVEYLVQTNGHNAPFGPISLAGAVVNQPYVQLLWRYYYVDGSSGARAQLRLDDILIGGQ